MAGAFSEPDEVGAVVYPTPQDRNRYPGMPLQPGTYRASLGSGRRLLPQENVTVEAPQRRRRMSSDNHDEE